MLVNDIETARFNMIAQQIRPWEVIDERVLDALQRVPREQFVDAEYRGLAFADIAVPIGDGQTMMKPVQEGRMLQALDVRPGDDVLEIGTGSGFMAACLARLGGRVISYEIRTALSEAAAARLRRLGVKNVELVVGDGLDASLTPGSFDVIAVTGSLPVYVDSLETLLKPGGRLFVVTGREPAMHALLVSHNADGEAWREKLFETVLPPLDRAPQPERFSF
ncbi:MAG: protein-L-isoaspartate O-methyltransferase [Chromatiaceae bacterium]|nr:protein-L-isoaspartate O-methyltransferase [Gammaproteobacteria bacterium]MCP5300190.1 protein-L-isoaspartate O-methyltransferase [Chromatiaceae bacterium]MCP5422262.1 protein-L-isoaspartate O-methyltransferase [Chromatiaceae bacterium]